MSVSSSIPPNLQWLNHRPFNPALGQRAEEETAVPLVLF
jgi:hypothetical protein